MFIKHTYSWVCFCYVNKFHVKYKLYKQINPPKMPYKRLKAYQMINYITAYIKTQHTQNKTLNKQSYLLKYITL